MQFSPAARLAGTVFILLAAPPARAELKVSVSRSSAGQYQSVGITVKDPKGGVEIAPGPITVTMADSADQRQDILLDPTGRAGEWSGRFTPMRPGRYTGTVLLERGDEKEIGLVPLVRCVRSSSRGFVRLNPRSRRSLKYANGTTLFPIGVRLVSDDVRLGMDWKTLFRRLRANEVNFVEIPVAWPEELPESERQMVLRSVDAALVEAESTGRLAVQLKLLGPAMVSEAGLTTYEAQLQRCVRRWAYSPAVASFLLAGATDEVSPEARLKLVRAVRAVDPYRHLVSLPGAAGDRRSGGDILVLPWNWQRPVNRFALLEVPDKITGPAPLPGESSWQMLVLGGVGLPLWPYRHGSADGATVLERIRRLAKVAGTIPYQVDGTPISGVVPVDTPGSFCRYGKVLVGWTVPDVDRVLRITGLPRGRYRTRLFDPTTDAQSADVTVWSDGKSARVEVPPSMKAAFVQLQPGRAAPAKKRRR
jgi:hypothetical protein